MSAARDPENAPAKTSRRLAGKHKKAPKAPTLNSLLKEAELMVQNFEEQQITDADNIALIAPVVEAMRSSEEGGEFGINLVVLLPAMAEYLDQRGSVSRPEPLHKAVCAARNLFREYVRERRHASSAAKDRALDRIIELTHDTEHYNCPALENLLVDNLGTRAQRRAAVKRTLACGVPRDFLTCHMMTPLLRLISTQGHEYNSMLELNGDLISLRRSSKIDLRGSEGFPNLSVLIPPIPSSRFARRDAADGGAARSGEQGDSGSV